MTPCMAITGRPETAAIKLPGCDRRARMDRDRRDNREIGPNRLGGVDGLGGRFMQRAADDRNRAGDNVLDAGGDQGRDGRTCFSHPAHRGLHRTADHERQRGHGDHHDQHRGEHYRSAPCAVHSAALTWCDRLHHARVATDTGTKTL